MAKDDRNEHLALWNLCSISMAFCFPLSFSPSLSLEWRLGLRIPGWASVKATQLQSHLTYSKFTTHYIYKNISINNTDEN